MKEKLESLTLSGIVGVGSNVRVFSIITVLNLRAESHDRPSLMKMNA